MRLTPVVLGVLLSGLLASCSSQSGDPHSDNGIPEPGGKGQRIREIVDPTLPGHAERVDSSQSISGAVVIAVDTYDETRDGKNKGDIFIQDLGATTETPYSGINLFATTYNPGNLKVSPGDVLDMTGTYQETKVINSTRPVVFPEGSMLTQLAFATATFRYETAVPAPLVIDASDLLDFKKAQRWIGMLVTVKNVAVAAAPFVAGTGRSSVDMATVEGSNAADCSSPFPKPWQITNGLMDLAPLDLQPGVTFKSITGVLGFFCSVQLAPRSPADLQR